MRAARGAESIRAPMKPSIVDWPSTSFRSALRISATNGRLLAGSCGGHKERDTLKDCGSRRQKRGEGEGRNMTKREGDVDARRGPSAP